ncbi:hypothetical protein GU926_18195 [Nibribacter ruber]|uniref:Uncharacterized protein n=1 Tax=Nibribacter ruber TaxID=2698458 RepID=A0A6P1P495_9BACT|nr:hypothetical protein [Nibribacter ruber]QHL89259.1 hypothetical protein GU926_18195 [Nibribacter ruber]
MKTLFILCISLLFTCQLFAQTQAPVDSIQIKKGFSTVFLQNGKSLSPKELLEITQSNPAAHEQMQLAYKKGGTGTVFFSTVGGLLIAWPLLATSMDGGKRWAMAGTGVGIVAVGFKFSSSYAKHATKAVHLYNSGQLESSLPKLDMKLGFMGNGLGFHLKF